MLAILGWAATAHADDAAPPAAAGTRTVADTPSQLVLPQGHLFGDWAGTRAWLEERPASYSDIYLTVSSCDGGRRHHA
jgi:hypothetical protein